MLEARGEPATSNRPYNQSFSYDVWDNMTARTGKHWSKNITAFLGTYVDNRLGLWGYDADGRVTGSSSVSSTFDAAGRLVQAVGPTRRNNPPLILVQDFDGDGRRVKKTEYGSTTYFLCSTVLSGVVISEIYGTTGQSNFGQKQKGHVYANGTELAEQNTFLNVAQYQHHEPSNGEQGVSYTHPDTTIVWGRTQLDPFGDDVGDEDPYLDQGGGGDSPGFNYPHFGDISDPNSGCTVDGQPWPCTSIGFFFNGTTMVKSVTAGLNGPLIVPQYEWKDNPPETGDACKIRVCPSIVTVNDTGGQYVIAGYEIVSNDFPMRAMIPQNSTDLIKINHAFGDASTGISQVKGKKDPCHDFFTQGRSLEEVSAIFSSFWKSAFHDERAAATASTANSGHGLAATLRLGNAFFADDNSVPGTGLSFSFANNMYLSDAYQLTPRQNRALTILHEFAHALGLIPSDNPTVDPSGKQSAKNDAAIYEKCKNILNSLPLKD